jgi:hypothetical protein
LTNETVEAEETAVNTRSASGGQDSSDKPVSGAGHPPTTDAHARIKTLPRIEIKAPCVRRIVVDRGGRANALDDAVIWTRVSG